MNAVLSDGALREFDRHRTIQHIGFVVSAINKIEPELVPFTCRGQADIYKDNKKDTPLFIAMTRSYQVSEGYARYGDIVRVEGHNEGHIVFFKDVWGYDISGLSSVPPAKELITLPQIISYVPECFVHAPETKFIPYYFGILRDSNASESPLVAQIPKPNLYKFVFHCLS